MDVAMTFANKGTWVTSGTVMQAASSVGGQAVSSEGGGEAPEDGEEAGPSDGGGAGMNWVGGAGPSRSGEAGPSWNRVPSQYARGERKNKQDYWESRRKRKNKSSTGEVTAKKIKTSVAEGPDKKKNEVEAWRSDRSMTFYHSLYKKQNNPQVNKDDKLPENTPGPRKRALKRKGQHKEVPFTEAVIMPVREYNNNFSSFMKTEKPAIMPFRFVNGNFASPPNSDAQNAKAQKKSPAKVLNLENPYRAEGDDDSSIAELLHGMSVQGPDDDVNAAAGSRHSKFNHQRVVWWTTTNWHEVRNGAAEYEDGDVGRTSCSRGRRIVQNRENGLSADGTTYSVPEALILDPPREPVNFDREDAENAAAARARLSRRRRQRRLAVSDSDIDVEHAKEFEEFVLFRGERESVVSSDSSYSTLCNSSTDSSESSRETTE